MARDNPEPSAMGHFSAFASFPTFFLATWSKASNAPQPGNVSRSPVQKGLDNSTGGGWRTGQSPLSESMTCPPTPERLRTGGAFELIQQQLHISWRFVFCLIRDGRPITGDALLLGNPPGHCHACCWSSPCSFTPSSTLRVRRWKEWGGSTKISSVRARLG